MIRAAIYARFSSDLQRETSIEDQERICKERITQEGWHFTVPYTDFAISGASLERAGLRLLMSHAAAHEFDVLVVEGLDRISRDTEHMAGIYKRLSFYGVRIYSLTDGGFVSDIHIAFGGAKNALFLKDLAFKVKRGMRGRVENGKAIGRRTFGYDIVRRFDSRGEPVRGERSINEQEAMIVRRIFTHYAKGVSAHKIAMELNNEGIPSPEGKRWASSTLNGSRGNGKGILNNSTYVGELVWNRHSYHKNPDTEKKMRRLNDEKDWVTSQAPELRIVEQAIWDKVKARQAALAKKKKPHLKRRPKHLLSYLLKCGRCGGGYSTVSKTHYGCTNAKHTQGCTNKKTIGRAKLEKAVLDGIMQHILIPDMLDAFTKEYNHQMAHIQQSRTANISTYEQQMEKLDKEKARLVDAIKAGIPASELKDEFNKNAQARAECESLIKQFSQSTTKSVRPDMAQRFKQAIAKTKQDANNHVMGDEGIDTIRQLISKVVMTPNAERGKLDVHLHGDLAGLISPDEGGGLITSLKSIADQGLPDQQVMNTVGYLSKTIIDTDGYSIPPTNKIYNIPSSQLNCISASITTMV